MYKEKLLLNLGVSSIPRPNNKAELLQAQKAIGGLSFQKGEQKGEYIPFMFRVASATIFGIGSWKATEFPEKLLPEIAKVLENKPAYYDHELSTKNTAGVVGTPFISKKKKNKDGTIIPAGVDAPIWIDSVLNMDLVRKLSAFPAPEIQSVSATLEFTWKPSHNYEKRDGSFDYYAFFERLGEKDDDGQIVRRIAETIEDGIEVSFVWSGADPFAKYLGDDGSPVNVAYKNSIENGQFEKASFNTDPFKPIYEKQKMFFCNEKPSQMSDFSIYLSEYEKLNFQKPENNMKEILMAIAKKANLKAEELTIELVETLAILPQIEYDKIVNSNSELSNSAASFEAEKTRLKNLVGTEKQNFVAFKEKVENQTTVFEKAKTELGISKLDELLSYAEKGKKSLDKFRSEILKAYRVTIGNSKENETIVKAINEGNIEQLEMQAELLKVSLPSQFSATCKACGSTELDFRSSQPNGEQQTQAKINRLVD